MVATDLLSGNAAPISTGPPSEAIRASAARLGATSVYVLRAGVPCALPRPPRSAVGVAVHALTVLIEQRLITDVADPPAGAKIHLMPPLCHASVSVSASASAPAADFSHAAHLIQRSHRASAKWLEDGGPRAACAKGARQVRPSMMEVPHTLMPADDPVEPRLIRQSLLLGR